MAVSESILVTGEVLLDTNVVIALLEREPAALERFQQQGEGSISIITLGELLFAPRNRDVATTTEGGPSRSPTTAR